MGIGKDFKDAFSPSQLNECPQFGFETNYRDTALSLTGKTSNSRATRWLNNASKCIAYIPGVNIVSGLAKLIFGLVKFIEAAASNQDKEKGLGARIAFRGISEFLCGPWLIIADLAYTAIDHGKASRITKENERLAAANQ